MFALSPDQRRRLRAAGLDVLLVENALGSFPVVVANHLASWLCDAYEDRVSSSEPMQTVDHRRLPPQLLDFSSDEPAVQRFLDAITPKKERNNADFDRDGDVPLKFDWDARVLLILDEELTLRNAWQAVPAEELCVVSSTSPDGRPCIVLRIVDESDRVPEWLDAAIQTVRHSVDQPESNVGFAWRSVRPNFAPRPLPSAWRHVLREALHALRRSVVVARGPWQRCKVIRTTLALADLEQQTEAPPV